MPILLQRLAQASLVHILRGGVLSGRVRLLQQRGGLGLSHVGVLPDGHHQLHQVVVCKGDLLI